MENSFILPALIGANCRPAGRSLRVRLSKELVALLEAQLPPEQVPYLDAFLADDEPKDIAPRLGISAKAASARMRRFKVKLGKYTRPYAAD